MTLEDRLRQWYLDNVRAFTGSVHVTNYGNQNGAVEVTLRPEGGDAVKFLAVGDTLIPEAE